MARKQQYVFVSAVILLCLPLFVSAQWLETTIDVGDGPYALTYNSTNNKVYCANFYGRSVTVIDGATNTVVATIPLLNAGHPWELLYNPISNKIYCANYYSDSLNVIDCATDSVSAIVLNDFTGALAYNNIDNKVYAAIYDDNAIAVIDGAIDSVIAIIDLGYGWVWTLAYNQINNKIYCGSTATPPVVTVIDAGVDTVITTIPLEIYGHPRALIHNPTNNKVYCADYTWGTVPVIDGEGDSIITIVGLGSGGVAFAYNTINNKVYCAGMNHAIVGVIDGVTDSIITIIHTGISPLALVYNYMNNKIYNACASEDFVAVIDGESDSVITTISVGDGPRALAWNPIQNRTYVANYFDASVSVLRDSMTGIYELAKETSPQILNLYPNPTRALLNIRTSIPLRSIEIYDVIGQLVRTEKMTRPAHETTISSKNLSAGVYFMKVNMEGGGLIRKVIVTK